MIRLQNASAAALVTVAALYTAVLVWFSYEFTHFWGDDLTTFLLVQDVPLGEALFTDLGSQFVPLHRLVNLALYRVAPMSYGAALTVLGACHLATALYLYRTLSLLGSRRASILCVAAYMVHPFAGVNFLWFTSGLTRYPYLACAAAALFHYLSFALHGRRRDLVCVFGLYLVSLGFYSKTILFPFYLAGAELSARAIGWLPAAPGTLRARVATVLVLLGAGAAYVLAVESGLDPAMARMNSDPWSILRVIADALVLLLETTLAWELHRDLAALGRVVAFAVGLAALYALLRSRRVGRPLGVLAGLAALNVALIAASSRVLLFGEWHIAIDYRYQFELWFLCVLFGGIALHGAREGSRPLARLGQSRTVLVALPLILALHGVESLRGFRFAATERLWYGAAAREYFDNLEEGLDSLPAGGEPPTFVDGLVPRHLNTLDFGFTRHSHLFRAIGREARFAAARAADYQVADDGSVLLNPAKKRPRRARRSRRS